MDHQPASQVEFLGGPIDGHVDCLNCPLNPLLGLKFNRPWSLQQLWSSLRDLPYRWRDAKAIPLAVYELAERDDGTPIYKFLGTQLVLKDQLRRNERSTHLLKDSRKLTSH